MELEQLVSKNFVSFPIKYANAYFFGSYFKNFFRDLLSKIDNTLIPKHKFETHDSLDGLSEEVQQEKLRELIKYLQPLQRVSLKLSIDFLSKVTTHSDTS